MKKLLLCFIPSIIIILKMCRINVDSVPAYNTDLTGPLHEQSFAHAYRPLTNHREA